MEIQDHDGRRLVTARIEEGVAGIARLHALTAMHGGHLDPDQVLIETDRGLWVQALVAAGYRVFAVNPRQAARFRCCASSTRRPGRLRRSDRTGRARAAGQGARPGCRAAVDPGPDRRGAQAGTAASPRGPHRTDPRRPARRATGRTGRGDRRERRAGGQHGRDDRRVERADRRPRRRGGAPVRPASGGGDLPQPARGGGQAEAAAAGGVRGRPAPLRQREGAQELRRDQPDHPAVRAQTDCVGAAGAQRPARRRAVAPSPGCDLGQSGGAGSTTTSSAPAAPGIKPRCDNSGTGWFGILHGCLACGRCYDEDTAWPRAHDPVTDPVAA